MHELDLCAIVRDKWHSAVYVLCLCFYCPVRYFPAFQKRAKSTLLYYNAVRNTSSAADNEREGSTCEPLRVVQTSSFRPYTVLWGTFLESLAEAAGLRGPRV